MKIFVGYDERESIAYHVFVQSLIEHSTQRLDITPLVLKTLAGYRETHTDGSNAFIYSRFLIPELMGYSGWAAFFDGDMIVRADINELFELRNPKFAVQVVKHEYKTKYPKKYLGSKNEDYPRKNWSSVVLWNCGHPSNKALTKDFVMTASGSQLHRFNWLDDDLIGDLPKVWNWLDLEYPENDEAKLVHFTVGTPCFRDYRSSRAAEEWFALYSVANNGFDDSRQRLIGDGEDPI